MAQKRKFYVKTASGVEEQLVASAADIVEIDTISGLNATNVQDALEEIKDLADNGGVTSVNGKTGAVTLAKGDVGLGNLTNDAQVKRSEMGKASGVATLDTSGKVPTSQLPSYVDDVIIGYYNSAGDKLFYHTKQFTQGVLIDTDGQKIYIDIDTNKTYRWSGVDGVGYVEISASLALGETSSTAYAGDKGKANATNIATLQSEMNTAKTDISNIKNGTTKAKKAESADKLTTARKISLTGDATGETTFDGSADKSIALTLANSGVTAGTYSALTVDAKGRATAGAQIVEWGTSKQTTPSSSLAVGGLFFALVE